nr:reverse transcriptase domain-containing protein [Tanacetum cinerariifolium]
APRSPEYVPNLIELEDHVPLHIPKHPEDLVPAEDEAPIEAYILEMRAEVPSTYHSLLPSGTPLLLPIPLPVPSTSHRAEIPEADTPPRKRLLLTAPRLGCEVGESSAATREDLARSEAYSRALEARVAVLETQACRHKWQRQTTDDLVVQHIMRTQALEAGARIDTLEDTVAQALPWKNLKKMMTDKYCPRGEIKKLETKMWELKTKGTDVIGYSRLFQELALMCDRMFPEESDRVKKYIGGLPDTIHDIVKATKPKTMQEAIEFAT